MARAAGLRRLQLVGPADLVELGLAPNAPLDLEARIPVAWLLRLWQLAAERGAPADLGLQLVIDNQCPVVNANGHIR